MALVDFGDNRPTNPSKKFLEWSSQNKSFKYYDKQLKQSVPVALPLKPLMFLARFSTVTGFNEAANKGIGSNEVRNTNKENLNVFVWGNGTIAEGLWKDIHSEVKTAGGKFTVSLYAVMDGEMVNFQLSGAARGAIIEFLKSTTPSQLGQQYIICNISFENWKGKEEGKPKPKTGIIWSEPLFELSQEKISENDDLLSIELGLELKDFVEARAQYNDQKLSEDEKTINAALDGLGDADAEPAAEPKDDLPF